MYFTFVHTRYNVKVINFYKTVQLLFLKLLNTNIVLFYSTLFTSKFTLLIETANIVEELLEFGCSEEITTNDMLWVLVNKLLFLHSHKRH